MEKKIIINIGRQTRGDQRLVRVTQNSLHELDFSSHIYVTSIMEFDILDGYLHRDPILHQIHDIT